MKYRRQRVAQLVGEHREELVLAPVRFPHLRGLLAELFLQPLPAAHVDSDSDHPDRFAARVLDDLAAGVRPPRDAVGAHDAELLFVREPGLDRAPDRGFDPLPVVRMDHGAEGFIRPREPSAR